MQTSKQIYVFRTNTIKWAIRLVVNANHFAIEIQIVVNGTASNGINGANRKSEQRSWKSYHARSARKKISHCCSIYMYEGHYIKIRIKIDGSCRSRLFIAYALNRQHVSWKHIQNRTREQCTVNKRTTIITVGFRWWIITIIMATCRRLGPKCDEQQTFVLNQTKSNRMLGARGVYV